MQKQLTLDQKSEFAEKCRRALERSYGMKVPMPKCAHSKHDFFRRGTFDVQE